MNKTREAYMEDVNGATLRAVEYLIEQGVIKDQTVECDNLFEKISFAIEEHFNYPDYANYN